MLPKLHKKIKFCKENSSHADGIAICREKTDYNVDNFQINLYLSAKDYWIKMFEKTFFI